MYIFFSGVKVCLNWLKHETLRNLKLQSVLLWVILISLFMSVLRFKRSTLAQPPFFEPTYPLSMLRARRHASVLRLQILINQLIFFMKVRMTVLQLQCHIEETVDLLQDLGFTGHFIVVFLDQIHAEIQRFLRMCDRAISGLEYRLFDIFLRRLHI